MADRRAYFRARRDAARGTEARVLRPHGTMAAVRRHQRAGEPLCDLCRVEHNAWHRDYYAKRKRTT